MSAINDGGPAFPGSFSHYQDERGEFKVDASAGMTLRDYFAGKALCAYLAGRNIDARDTNSLSVATTCYSYADAMIAARDARKEAA